MLNSFQHPLRSTRRFPLAQSSLAARRMLKRVQHDGWVCGGPHGDGAR